MIKIELSRDETLTVYQWLEYMVKTSQAKLSITNQSDTQWIATVVSVSLLDDINTTVQKKLIDKNKKCLRISLSYAHAAHLMLHMFALPIPVTSYWIANLRQRICNEIHQHIFSMKTGVSFDLPITIDHYSQEYLNNAHYE